MAILNNTIEALSFKLALDFVKYLKKNRIYLYDIRLSYYDKIESSYEFFTFNDLSEMDNHYTEYYLKAGCKLGRLVSIQIFRADSDAYDFKTSYRGIDVSSRLNYRLESLSSFDIKRNPIRRKFIERQITFINNTVDEYVNFYEEIKYIYETGIYSPCYAEPGWSENTWWLKSLRETIIKDNTNRSKFPYTKIEIEKEPPE